MHYFARTNNQNQNAFTIVELLIVIVVIAVLAAISIIAYNGIQNRARESKIKQDISALSRAIQAARTADGATMKQITGNDETGGACRNTDPLTQDKLTAPCWTVYRATLQALTAKGGANFGSNFVDPYGRPYALDENEVLPACSPDSIGMYAYPYVTGYNDTHYTIVPTSGQCLP